MENSVGKFWEDGGQNIQTIGATSPGPFIMTMFQLTYRSLCSSLWPLRIRQSSSSLTTHRTQTLVIFFYSLRWNCSSRGHDSTALKRSRPYRRKWWRRWRQMTSGRASDHENPAWIAVSVQKGDYFEGDGGE